MIQLQIITFKDNKRKEAFIVKNFPATFGRDPSCTYTFFEDGASRVHFSIECIENAFFLKDLKSTNGTKLNGEEVIHEVQLHNKDIIVAGKSVFEVVLKELFFDSDVTQEISEFLDSPDEPSEFEEGNTGTFIFDDTKEKFIHSHKALKIMYIILRACNTSGNSDKLISQLIPSLIQTMEADRGGILLKKQDKKYSTTKKGKVYNWSFSTNILTNVIEKGKPVISYDIEKDYRYNFLQSKWIKEVKSFICVPISSEKMILGAIYLDHQKKSFIEEDLELLRAIGLQIGTHLEKTFLFEELRDTNTSLKQEIENRKKVEDERKELQEQLHQVEKMKALGELAGGVAHDLNNILCGLVSYPDLLIKMYKEDEFLHDSLSTIYESGKKATAIVHDLLTIARRGVKTEEVIVINDIIADYLTSGEYHYLKEEYPDVEVETKFNFDIGNAFGSPVHLSKTVMNLITNAFEAMPGGGKLIISTEQLQLDGGIINGEAVPNGEYILITFCDTGIGIAPENQKRIFEPFYTKKVMGMSGSGLGMAVVWGAIKDHKGFIDIESYIGHGTTFKVYLPVTKKKKGKKTPIINVEEYLGDGESILVVDDIPKHREIACMMLDKLGYKVKMAISGEDAIEYVKKNSFDLVILDMIMEPGIDGLTTYKNILTIKPEQKVIFVSGFTEDERFEEVESLGGGSSIKKPYTLEILGVAVRQALLTT